jgi:hypothetical protein
LERQCSPGDTGITPERTMGSVILVKDSPSFFSVIEEESLSREYRGYILSIVIF